MPRPKRFETGTLLTQLKGFSTAHAVALSIAPDFPDQLTYPAGTTNKNRYKFICDLLNRLFVATLLDLVPLEKSEYLIEEGRYNDSPQLLAAQRGSRFFKEYRYQNGCTSSFFYFPDLFDYLLHRLDFYGQDFHASIARVALDCGYHYGTHFAIPLGYAIGTESVRGKTGEGALIPIPESRRSAAIFSDYSNSAHAALFQKALNSRLVNLEHRSLMLPEFPLTTAPPAFAQYVTIAESVAASISEHISQPLMQSTQAA